MLTTTLPTVRHRHPLLYKLIYFGFAWLLAAVVLSIVVREPGIERASGPIKIVPDMVFHHNERPVVTRALIPWVIEGLAGLVPDAQADRLTALARTQPFLAHQFAKYGWLPEFAAVYLVALVVLYVCLLGFFYAFRYFMRGIFEGPRVFIDLGGLVALAGIPPLTAGLHTLYDFGTLFFMAAGLGLMVRRHWLAYLPVFVLACLNRETAILLTFICVVNAYDLMPRGRLVFFTLVQFAVWFAVRFWIGWLYRGNPGGVVEFQYVQNIKNLFLAPSYSLAQLLAVLALLFLIFNNWPRKPLFLKRALIWFVPTLVVYFAVGILNEWRIYFEWYPIFLCLALDNVKPVLRV